MDNNRNRKGLSKAGFIYTAVGVLFIIAVIAAFTLLKPASVIKPEALDGDGFYRTAYPLSQPLYPEMAAYPNETGRDFSAELELWQKSVEAQYRDIDCSGELNDFFRDSIAAFLSGAEDENRIISPLNLYMSLSMLAEISEGDSRREILAALNCPDIETLRRRASDVWNMNYRSDGATSISLGNSLWLRDDMEYSEETVKRLADDYYASVYAGIMGSEEYDSLLQSWLSEQTQGLLDDSAQGEGFDSDTLLSLASAVCYKARWSDEFSPENTEEGIFHAANGDIETSFMKSSRSDKYYRGEHFGALKLPLADGGGSMSLILPDEDISCEEIINDSETLNFIFSGGDWDNSSYLIVNLSLPKFDAAADADLKPGFERLGVKSVLTQAADFSPLFKSEGAYLSGAKHAVRVAVDEEGVSAAAYTLMQIAGAGRPPEEVIDFTLDRPFIFVINSDCGQCLFAGIVNRP